MAIRYNSGAAREATGLKQMPIRARTHKTGAGGMSASLIGHSGSSAFRLSTKPYAFDVDHEFDLAFSELGHVNLELELQVGIIGA